MQNYKFLSCFFIQKRTENFCFNAIKCVLVCSGEIPVADDNRAAEIDILWDGWVFSCGH